MANAGAFDEPDEELSGHITFMKVLPALIVILLIIELFTVVKIHQEKLIICSIGFPRFWHDGKRCKEYLKEKIELDVERAI